VIRKIVANIGRIALLLFVALLAFTYLASGLDGSKATAIAKPVRSAEANNESQTMASEPNSVVELSEPLKALNRCFEAEWEKEKLNVAEPANWSAVCRRISLAMVGSGVSLKEIRDLEKLPEDDRVNAYIEKLLVDSRFHDYWAERFTRVYVGADDGPFIAFRRRRFRLWLSDEIAANRRYDALVRSLVETNGLWTDRPAVNFLTVTVGTNEEGQPDPIRLAARTTRAFLGLRIDCLQCHDDFLGYVALGEADALREGKQTDFHSLAAFYSSARVNGLQGIKTEDRPYEYQFLNAEEATTVEPGVPYLANLLPASGSPRERLAAWLTHPENKQAARAAVSRVWALMYGRSITKAVDNIPLNEALHPAVDLLADDFVKHEFDMRRLIRLIVHSRPFQLDSAADFEITERHEQAWSVFPLTRLRPEQVAGSVIQSARVKTVDRDSSLLTQLIKYGSVNDFVTGYGDIGEDEFDQDNVTITQRLIMLNGELVSEHSKEDELMNAGSHILLYAKDDNAAIDAAYQSVLNRMPDDEERSIFAKRLADSKDRKETMVDLFWVLLNSSEFAWNH